MKLIAKTGFLLIALLLSGFAFGNELDKADALYDQGQYKEALAIYQKPDFRGMAIVQNRIGNIYLKPGMKDDKKSAEWFQKAANQGDARGIHNLGMAYLEAVGVPQDYSKALNLFKQAADKGLASSMNSLGIMYKNGLGVKKDEKEAVRWYVKSAEAGSSIGVCNVAGSLMYSNAVETDYKKAHELLDTCLKVQPTNDCCLDRMAELYSSGLGVPENNQKAHELRLKAAKNGSGVAMYNLGRDYDYGIGVEKNPKAAMGWYLKAADKDHAKAMYRLYEVYEYGKLGQAADKTKANEWKASAEKVMKEQGLSRNAWVDDFRLKLEDER